MKKIILNVIYTIGAVSGVVVPVFAMLLIGWSKPFVQNDGIVRQNDETAKNLLQNHLKYAIIIMERGSGTDSTPIPKNK
jgi:hypothetical protein